MTISDILLQAPSTEGGRLLTLPVLILIGVVIYIFWIMPEKKKQKKLRDLIPKKARILEEYRAGLSYLDECGAFDEAKFREFNRITGNRFSNADIENQLRNAKLMIGGMENVKQTLRSSMVEAIGIFEEMERNGIDLSNYNV